MRRLIVISLALLGLSAASVPAVAVNAVPSPAAKVIVVKMTAATARAQYADDGGGNRPDCNEAHAGWWWNNMECSRDPFAPPGEGWDWHLGN